MPEDVRSVYEEARTIAQLSPRSSAALLRVALERLVHHLTERARCTSGSVSWSQRECHSRSGKPWTSSE